MTTQPQDTQPQATKFRILMASAQADVPPLQRRMRIFLEDGTEIFGVISFELSGGESDHITGLRERTRVKLEFDGEQFTVER